MFQSCYSIESLDIPTSVVAIGENGLLGCTSLLSVEIPDAVQTIGNDAISYCDVLATVIVGSGVASIGARCFEGDNALTSVFFKGKTLAQVQAMTNYPWGASTSVFSAELG